MTQPERTPMDVVDDNAPESKKKGKKLLQGAKGRKDV